MKACCPLVPCPPGAIVALPMPMPVPTSVTSGFAAATLCSRVRHIMSGHDKDSK